RQFGVGMRRRCQNPNGADKIEEMTAWYEGLGYEYRIVDDSQYRQWFARLRLQAVPEGTIVQWTIRYEVKGMVSNLLHGMTGQQKKIEAECVASLRQLR